MNLLKLLAHFLSDGLGINKRTLLQIEKKVTSYKELNRNKILDFNISLVCSVGSSQRRIMCQFSFVETSA